MKNEQNHSLYTKYHQPVYENNNRSDYDSLTLKSY